MLSLSSLFSSLELWLENHTSIYEDSELNSFKNINFLGEISSNSLISLLGTVIIVVDNITID